MTEYAGQAEVNLGMLVKINDNLTNSLSLIEGGTIDISKRNIGTGSSLFGRIMRASLTYRF
ncbi:hypothetical protein CLG96_14705 [Sphingomonas oleivorans]|uniref:Uncharacterized protein n=1 Tax=Sphingomonas oleivorans TaxID=1735121 RepID=A0A2T5FVG7_9SPHN|nr:hypothetical protein [Sphingomonas oleivorans]PTQ09436.1 hypothetical protein CLG96_14705 [Sphingomonas oleivorans]